MSEAKLLLHAKDPKKRTWSYFILIVSTPCDEKVIEMSANIVRGATATKDQIEKHLVDLLGDVEFVLVDFHFTENKSC